MDWSPGRPVTTEADRRAWEAWRMESKLAGQRASRRRLCRIDWEASPEMRAYLAGLQERSGWPPSSVIGRMRAREGCKSSAPVGVRRPDYSRPR
jgi:hypothetical protein